MGLIPIPNAPIKFGTNFNALDADCNCVTKEFLTPQYDDDQIEFMYKFSLCGDGDAITNGDFSNGDTGWIIQSGWSVINGLMCSDGSNGLFRQNSLTAGKKYFLKYEIKGSTTGNILPTVSGYDGTFRTGNGTFIDYLETNDIFIEFNAVNGFDGCIDNITVIEIDLTVFGGSTAPNLVTNGTFTTNLSGWTVGAGWTQSAGTALQDGAGLGVLSQTITGSQTGLLFLVTFDIIGMTTGFLGVNIDNAVYSVPILNTNGTFQFVAYKPVSDTIVNDGELTIQFSPGNGFDGAIDNVKFEAYALDFIVAVNIPNTGGDLIGTPTSIMSIETGNHFRHVTYNNSSNIFSIGDCYKIEIISACDSSTLVSEHFKIVSNDCNLKLLTWTNKINAFGFEYKNSGLTHRLRIAAKLRKPSYTGDKDIFIDSQGGGQITATEKRKQSQLEIFDMPEYLHDALSIMIDHTDIKLDGVDIIVQESDYEPNWRNSSLLASIAIAVEEKTQNLINRNCE